MKKLYIKLGLYSLLMLSLLLGNSQSVSIFVFSLTETTPLSGASNISASTNIELSFNDDVFFALFEVGGFKDISVSGSHSGRIEGLYSNPRPDKIVFDPLNDFFPGETISVVVTTGILNTGENPLSSPYFFQFTVATDPVPDPIAALPNEISNPIANNASFVTVSDIDGDLDLDVLAASTTEGQMAWYENSGDLEPTFAEHIISQAQGGGVCASVYDLDNDGDQDVVGGYSNKLVWYENNGGTPPTFVEILINGSVSIVQSIQIEDLDLDGDADILISVSNSNKISWFENDGASDPSFTENAISTTAMGARGAAAGDMDSDGDLDIVATSQNDDKIAWFENDGASDPTFISETITTAIDGPFGLALGDVNLDGSLDIIYTGFNAKEVGWIENDGMSDPGFTVHPVSANENGAIAAGVGDVNGDGYLDLVAAARNSNQVSWYQNDGNATPSFEKQVISTLRKPVGVAVGDIDSDGKLDVLSAAESDEVISWFRVDQEQLPPTDVSLSSNEISENMDVGTVVGEISSTDINTGDTHDYTLSGVDQDVFTIEANQLKTAERFNHEMTSSYQVAITSTDQTGLSLEKNFEILVNDVPESEETDIIGFLISEQSRDAIIDLEDHTVEVEVELGTNLSNLNPIIVISEGASIGPTDQLDFTNPVTYTITAEDEFTTQEWTVEVRERPLSLLDPSQISVFPNPTAGQITINHTSILFYQLMDLSGKVLEEGPLKKQLSLSQRKPGVYMLHIESPGGVNQTIRLKKN